MANGRASESARAIHNVTLSAARNMHTRIVKYLTQMEIEKRHGI